MRIIAGSARSLPLKTVAGTDTRPTTDKIKETLFNMLQRDMPGCCFLDLFAGSGQIGLEALSRGAANAVFVENGRKAAKCIADNIRFTKFDSQARLMQMDVFVALRRLEGQEQFDVVFMDPPYDRHFEQQVLEYLSESSILKEDCLIVVEASLDTAFDYLGEYGFELVKRKEYRNNAHLFVRRINKEDTIG